MLLVVVVVVVAVAGLGSGSGLSGVAQALASLQTLASDQLLVESVLKDPRVLVAVVVEVVVVVAVVVVVVVAGLGLLLDRLNTEAVEVEVIVGEEREGWRIGALVLGGEDEKSKRSPSAAEGGAGLDVVEDDGAAEVRELQPEVLLMDVFAWWVDAGLGSKKLPPLRPEKAELLLVCVVGLVEAKDARLAKASVWAGLGEEEALKLRLLKASFSPASEL